MGKSTLTREQQKILGAISQERFITENFFFTGGTALSEFYFQHRFSEDLDFFSEQEFDSKRLLVTINKIADELKLTKVEQHSLTGQEVFYFYFSKSKLIKLDFAYFPFNHLGKFKKWKDLRVSSVNDIAINKIHAITTRKRKRDYFDLYLCATRLNWRIDDFKVSYRLKFDVVLPAEQLATSFVNVVDATDEPIFLGKINWKEVEKYFLKLANSLKKDIIE